MIEEGDRILVGVSGGKDSLALLWSLADKRPRAPVRYDLFPVFVDPGFPSANTATLEAFCEDLGFPLTVEVTDFGVRAHRPGQRENPCFLCARQRRRRLFERARTMGCGKIALGHHKDDLIETLFLNICYAGEIGTMVPAQPLFEGRLTLIRPLAYAEEELIARFGREAGFPQLANPCPSADRTRRGEIKSLLAGLCRGNPKVKGNIFRAMSRVRADYLLRREGERGEEARRGA